MTELKKCGICDEQDLLVITSDEKKTHACQFCFQEHYCKTCYDKLDEDTDRCLECEGNLMCGSCRGSGEGRYDGTSCGDCGGSGEDDGGRGQREYEDEMEARAEAAYDESKGN